MTERFRELSDAEASDKNRFKIFWIIVSHLNSLPSGVRCCLQKFIGHVFTSIVTQLASKRRFVIINEKPRDGHERPIKIALKRFTPFKIDLNYILNMLKFGAPLGWCSDVANKFWGW